MDHRSLAAEPAGRALRAALHLQERLGEQIAEALAELAEPHGIAVQLEAVHLCTQMRGVREERSKTLTSTWRGGYTESPELRREFLTLVQQRNARA